MMSEQDLLDEIERSTAAAQYNARILNTQATEHIALLSGLKSQMQVPMHTILNFVGVKCMCLDNVRGVE
jgi:hypothetical protein